VIDQQPKIEAYPGPMGPSGTEPEAVEVVRGKVFGTIFVLVGFETLQSARGVQKIV
jgi:hypothetical protein